MKFSNSASSIPILQYGHKCLQSITTCYRTTAVQGARYIFLRFLYFISSVLHYFSASVLFLVSLFLSSFPNHIPHTTVRFTAKIPATVTRDVTTL